MNFDNELEIFQDIFDTAASAFEQADLKLLHDRVLRQMLRAARALDYTHFTIVLNGATPGWPATIARIRGSAGGDLEAAESGPLHLTIGIAMEPSVALAYIHAFDAGAHSQVAAHEALREVEVHFRQVRRELTGRPITEIRVGELTYLLALARCLGYGDLLLTVAGYTTFIDADELPFIYEIQWTYGPPRSRIYSDNTGMSLGTSTDADLALGTLQSIAATACAAMADC